MTKSANKRCRRTTRRCVNGKCYRQQISKKRTSRLRCRNKSRRCGDNRCYKKK